MNEGCSVSFPLYVLWLTLQFNPFIVDHAERYLMSFNCVLVLNHNPQIIQVELQFLHEEVAVLQINMNNFHTVE